MFEPSYDLDQYQDGPYDGAYEGNLHDISEPDDPVIMEGTPYEDDEYGWQELLEDYQ